MAHARVLLVFSLLACLSSQAVAFTNPDQLKILEDFRDAMFARPNSRNWTAALASWTCPTPAGTSTSGTCDPCGQAVWGNWEHMACRGKRVSYTKYQVPGNGDVTNIHITDYSVPGTVPLQELCPLSSLTEFDIDGGLLVGPIPTGFAQCFPKLTEIDLSYNQLTGTLPKSMAEVRTLEQLKFETNRLIGTIPSEYGALTKLNWLRVADNKFTGTIPQSFANTAPHLYQLTMEGNDFSGNLYTLAGHSFVNFNSDRNPKMCGMVPVGVRFAHSYNPYRTRLGLPCPEELAGGWEDLSETL